MIICIGNTVNKNYMDMGRLELKSIFVREDKTFKITTPNIYFLEEKEKFEKSYKSIKKSIKSAGILIL